MSSEFKSVAGVSGRNASLKKVVLIFSDIIAIVFSIIFGWLASIVVRSYIDTSLPSPNIDIIYSNQAFLFAIPLLVICGLSWIWGHYSRFKPFWVELNETIKITLYAFAIDIVILFTIKSHFSRVWFFLTFMVVVVVLPLLRVLAKKILIKYRLWYTPTVIIGAGDNAIRSARAVESDITIGLEVIAFLNVNTVETINDFNHAAPVLTVGDGIDINRAYKELGEPYVIVALDSFENEGINKNILERWMSLCADLMIVPPIRGLPLYGAEVLQVFKEETMILRLKYNLMRAWPNVLKRCFDIVVSVFLLTVLSPLFIFIVFCIRRDGGTATYSHERVGHKGEVFGCLKFRSMVSNSDQILAELLANDTIAKAEWDRDFKLKNDPRITKIGMFLRKTSLDELPQLWNVVKGQMALVGPRPVVFDELERYGEYVSYYEQSRPGMTGLWQVSGRNDTTYEERVALDVWYARNWSFWHDLVILLKTIPVVLFRKGSY